MSAIGLGRIAFAVGMAGLGILSLLYGDFALQWQPVPAWVPWRQGVAYLSGIVLLVAGVGVLVRPFAARAAAALTVYLLILWVLPHVFDVVPKLDSVGAWLGFCETLAVMCGSWILYFSLLRQSDTRLTRPIDSNRQVRIARALFGISCIVFGLSHFVYADFTAGMIPSWLPERLWLAYLTGAGHILAGVGILCAVFPRLAATLEALMMSSFVLLVHIPSLVSPPQWAPTARIQWTALFWAASLAACAWIVAGSLRERSWRSTWTTR